MRAVIGVQVLLRRRVTRCLSVVSVGFLVVVGACLPTSAATAGPPVSNVFGQNSSRSGRTDGGGSRPPLTVAWTSNVQSNSFLTDGVRLIGFLPNYQAQTTTFTGWVLANGHKLWGPRVFSGYSSAALSGTSIFVATGTHLLRLDVATGRTIWDVKVGTDTGNTDPLVYNETVFDGVLRYSVATGKLLGKLAIPESYAGGHLAYGGGCIIAEQLGWVSCLDPTSGKSKWEHRNQNVVGYDNSSAVYAAGRVYDVDKSTFPYQPDVLDVRTGALVGHTPFPAAVGDTLGYRTVVTAQQKSAIQGYRLADGKISWQYQFPLAADGHQLTAVQSPLLANGVVYTIAESLDTSPTIIFAFDAKSGGLLWRSDRTLGAQAFYDAGGLMISPPFAVVARATGGRDGTYGFAVLKMTG
jgi:outer membrane protein assembly factor BamB